MARSKKPSETSDDTKPSTETQESGPEDTLPGAATSSDPADQDTVDAETTTESDDGDVSPEDVTAAPAPNLDEEMSDTEADDAVVEAGGDDVFEASEDEDVVTSERRDEDTFAPDPAPGVPLGVAEGSDRVAPASPPPPAAPPPATRSAFGSVLLLLLGGLIAGGIGWVAAQNTTLPPAPPADTSELEQALDAQADRIASLEGLSEQVQSIQGRLESLPEPAGPFDPSGLEAGQADLNEQVSTLSEQVGRLDSALQTLEADLQAIADRPAQVSPDGAQAMAEQLAAFRDELETLTADARAEVEAARARASEVEIQAAAREEQAAREAALADVRAALQSGEPYQEALSVFDEVPEGLAGPADTGVPTLSELRESYPDVARAALSETQVVPGEAGVTDRLGAFFRRQTNARSLQPREGDDTDAVLSRTEGAMASGDLDAALTELDGLSESAAAAVAEWREQVEIRRNAISGYDALSARITEN